MTPLESAKALAGDEPEDVAGHDRGSQPVYWFCGGNVWLHEHAPDCPWLAMPAIVAALEALAEYAKEENWSYNEWMGPEGDGARLARRVLLPPGQT